MFGVGAADAYFCDKFADLVARALRAKSLEPAQTAIAAVRKLQLPVATILAPYSSRTNWRWRMGARALIEKKHIHSLAEIKTHFNPFCRAGNKLLEDGVLASWMGAAGATERMFGTTRAAFLALVGPANQPARNAALKAGRTRLDKRLKKIFQRRHDCIHNCDRPKVAPQPISSGAANCAIRDIAFLVDQLEQHFEAEFRAQLVAGGYSAATRNAVGC